VATASSNEVDEIRRRMAQIRRELHEDVRDVVASAEAVTDWRRYLRMYPWLTLGLPFAVGYLIVPKRRRKIPRDIATQADVAQVREVVQSVAEKAREEPPKEKAKKGLFAMAWGLAAPIAIRAVQGYAIQFLENWIHQQQEQMQMGAGPPTPPPQPSAPGARGPGRMRGPGDY